MAFKLSLKFASKKRRCLACKKPIHKDTLSFGTAASYEDDDGEIAYGSTFWRHPECAERMQIMFLDGDLEQIKGYKDLSDEDKEAVETAFDMVVADGGKKRKTPTKKKSPAKKKQKTEGGSKKKKAKDPNAPKKNCTSYLLFCKAMRQELIKDMTPEERKATGAAMKALGAAWKEAEQDVWKQKARQDKERYQRQMKEYEETGEFTPEEEDGEETVGKPEAKSQSEKKTEKKKKKKRRLKALAGDEEEDEETQEEEEEEKERAEEEDEEEQQKEREEEDDDEEEAEI